MHDTIIQCFKYFFLLSVRLLLVVELKWVKYGCSRCLSNVFILYYTWKKQKSSFLMNDLGTCTSKYMKIYAYLVVGPSRSMALQYCVKSQIISSRTTELYKWYISNIGWYKYITPHQTLLFFWKSQSNLTYANIHCFRKGKKISWKIKIKKLYIMSMDKLVPNSLMIRTVSIFSILKKNWF